MRPSFVHMHADGFDGRLITGGGDATAGTGHEPYINRFRTPLSKQRLVETLPKLKSSAGTEFLEFAERLTSHLEDEPYCAEMLRAVAAMDLQLHVFTKNVVAKVPGLDDPYAGSFLRSFTHC